MPSKIKLSSKTNIGTSHYSTRNFLRSYVDRNVPLALKKEEEDQCTSKYTRNCKNRCKGQSYEIIFKR